MKSTFSELISKDAEVKSSPCDICSFGCPVSSVVKNGKILGVEPCKDDPLSRGFLCTKGYASRQYVYRDDRIKTPMKRTGERGSGSFASISWDEALNEIACKLNGIKAQYGADSVAFFSGYTKWYRPYLHRLAHSFGTLNYGTESSSCFQATVVANKCSSGCMTSPDVNNAGVIIGWGYDPYYSNLPTPALEKPKELGAKIIIVDPKETPAAVKLADLHLRPRPGTDGALALGMERELIVRNKADTQFIDEYVLGYKEFSDYAMEFTPVKVEDLTGVPASELIKAVDLICDNMPLCLMEGNAGMIHHINGVQNYRAVNALIALTGGYVKKGGNRPFIAKDPTGNNLLREAEFINQFRPENAKPKIGSEKYPLWSICIDEYQAMELAKQIMTEKPYPIKAIFALGMNARMFPHDEDMFKALEAVDFFVDTDIFMSDTAKYADIILPACTSFERQEIRSQGSTLAYYPPAIPPLYESRCDADIICDTAKALKLNDPILCGGYDACLEFMMEGLPVTLQELKVQGTAKIKTDAAKSGTFFHTASGKYELWSSLAEKCGLEPLPKYYSPYDDADIIEYPLILCSGGRLPNAFASRFHKVPWARSVREKAALDISPEIAHEYGLSQGDIVRLSTTAGSLTLPINITRLCLKDMVCLYHGYSEADVNSIIPKGHNDPYSGFPGYRSVRCRLEKVSDGVRQVIQVNKKHGTFSFDSSKCTGCGACLVACMERNNTDLSSQKAYRMLSENQSAQRLEFNMAFCAHCVEPDCMEACPVSAILKDSFGNVLINADFCVGCGACSSVCPQGMIYLAGDGKAHKCDGCADRIAVGLQPKCVEGCRFGAITHRITGTAAVILAGGRSSRMGTDKTALVYEGETFLQRAVTRYSTEFANVFVATAPGKTPDISCGLLYDETEGLGPLSGLLSALNTGFDRVFISAADIPNADPKLALVLIGRLKNHDACLIRRKDGKPEPTFAVYAKTCLPKLKAVMADGKRSFRALLDGIDVCYIDERELSGYDLDSVLMNVNTPEDFQRLSL